VSSGASALSWSGGKDSALALRTLRAESGAGPEALITTVTADYGRVSMHGVRRELLALQAQAAGIPLRGEADTTVFPAFTDQVYGELTAKGDRVPYTKFPNVPHGTVVAAGLAAASASPAAWFHISEAASPTPRHAPPRSPGDRRTSHRRADADVRQSVRAQ
jgi:Diphthamide synthase